MRATAWFDLGGSSMVAWLRGLLAAIAALTLGGTGMAADAENTLYMDVPFGRVVIEMRPDLAPNHCAQIKALARRGFYDGVVFHRVLAGFMAQTGDPNSADSQFFIMFAPSPSLDNQYTVWGQVAAGMEYIDKIKKGDPARNGSVVNPDKIIKMQVAADAIKAGDKGK